MALLIRSSDEKSKFIKKRNNLTERKEKRKTAENDDVLDAL